VVIPARAHASARAPRDRVVYRAAVTALAHAFAAEEIAAMLRGRTGAVPVELYASHVVRITDGSRDWPVARAAAEALLRRIAAARRDDLAVARRPADGAPLGAYRTRRRGEPERPYDTHLLRLDPIDASCGCPDFLRGSLGVCKHVAAVIEDLAASPRSYGRALAASRRAMLAAPRLAWDPVRPLAGPGDWLERVALALPAEDAPVAPALRAWFADAAGADGMLALRSAHADDPAERTRLADLLRAVLGSAPDPAPAVVALLAEERERLARVAELAGRAARFAAAIDGLARPLYPYQREGVARLLATGRLLLADDMGLGKTAQAIAVCHALFHAECAERGLVIVPATLKAQWRREWDLFTEAPLHVVDGSPEERARTYRGTKRGFLVVSYEQVIRDVAHLERLEADVVVLDEAQRIKNWATKTAACVHRLRPRYRLVLTGTPMENRLEELASILGWIDGFALEPKWRLVPWHSVHGDDPRDVVGARNLDVLRQRVAPHLLRRVRRDVLPQLPRRTDTTLPITLTEAQHEEHDALAPAIAGLMRAGARRPLAPAELMRLMRLLNTQRMIANGLAQLRFAEQWPALARIGRPDAALLHGLHSPKLLELREMLLAIAVDQGRKVVVFSQWRRMLQLAQWAAQAALADHGVRCAFFTGRESQAQRTRNLVELHDDPRLRVLFATDAGGVGLNLQRAATCCINLDVPWNPAVLEQRVARIHRIGQEEPIDVYVLVGQRCIEERIAAVAAGKQALFDGLFDGDSDEVRFDAGGSFMKALRAIVTPAEGAGRRRRGDEPGTDADEAMERELDAILHASDEAEDRDSAAALVEIKAPPGASGATLAEIAERVTLRRRPDGGLTIDVPAEVAQMIEALLASRATGPR
jgi:hypothetical protein